MANENSAVTDVRVGAALIVAVIGLLIPAVLVGMLAKESWTADNVLAIIGLFTSVVGTIVGAFLGVQIGAAGKAKAEDLAQRALGALDKETAKQVIESSRP
jgi:hypothetical protein